MSRFGNAFKAFIGNQSLNQDFEKPFMTILSNLGFGETTLKKLIKEGYTSNNHVYSVIDRIASDAAAIPLIVEEINSNGEKEIVTEGDFYNFVHNPNEDNNYKSFVYQSIVYQLTTGNTIQYGVKGVQAFNERWNLAPQYITPKVQNYITGPRATSYKYNYSGIDYNLEKEEVMHLTKFNPDPASPSAVMGFSPLEAAYRVLVASNEVITADASLIKNKGAIGLLTSKSDRALKTGEAKKLDASLKSRIGGGENYGSIKVTTGNVDFVKFAMSPQDLQILESGLFKLRDLCSIYKVSSRMFNDPTGASYNNSKEDNKKYYNSAVLPPLENDLDHFNKFFVPGWNERDGKNYVVRLDISSVEALQEDQAKEMIKSRTRSAIVTNILKGVAENKWSKESAVLQLMDALKMTETEAENIVGETPQPNSQPNEE